MGGYYVGQACRYGHQITGNIHSGDGSPHCPTCGQPTVSACEHCHANLRGSFNSDWVIVGGWSLADHCYACGKAHPWTEAKSAAVQELADAIEELTDYERSLLAELLPHIVQETPRSTAAGFKFAAIVEKVTGPGKGVMKDLIKDLAVDVAKKAMGLA